MTTPASPKTAEELHAAQVKEYGQYVAVDKIDLHGVRAFNKGDAVPVGHVEGDTAVVPRDLVAKSTTKAAQAAVENGS